MKMIIATSLNGCIGYKNSIPWQCPEDMKFFRDMTHGKTVLCGRKTFESFPERNGVKLPGRKICVLTKNNQQKIPSYATSFKGWKQFLNCNYSNQDVFVIGGAEIYSQALEFVADIYWSFILEIVLGDTYFPMNENINKYFVKVEKIFENSQVKIYHYKKKSL